LLVPSVVAQEA